MRDPVETGQSAHPKARAKQRLGEYSALRMSTRLAAIDESTPPRGPAVVIDDLLESRLHAGFPANDVTHWPHRHVTKVFRAGRRVRQHSSRFSVVALLANLWRPF